MKICHIGNLPLEQMGDITREIFNRCEGEHVYYHLKKIPPYLPGRNPFNRPPKPKMIKYDEIPKSDIYLLHCFKNMYDYFKIFKHPEGRGKIVSLIHSTFPCQPSLHSDSVVTISRAAEKHLEITTNQKSTMIQGAIDLDPFLQVQPDYEFPVVGKISRFEPGKYHDQYFNALLWLHDKYGNSVRIIQHDNFPEIEKYFCPKTMDHTAVIGKPETRAAALRKLSIYADAHDTGQDRFEETFCVSLLEAMASGLPCVILGHGQPAMVEVLGDGGIVVDNIYEFYKALETLINSPALCREWGLRARERAKSFSLDKMINEYNELFRGLCDGI